MEHNFVNLFRSNTLLQAAELDALISGSEYLTFDAVFASDKIVPADLQAILKKYGWFWIHLDKTKKDFVVNDISLEMDEKNCQLSYMDTSNGRIEQHNFTDFLKLLSESSSDIGKALIRLAEASGEGRSRLPVDALFPGFPQAPIASIPFPVLASGEASFTDIYTDFLYNSGFTNFPQYYFKYLDGITDLTQAEKAVRFTTALEKFITPQSKGPIPIFCNCIVTSKMQLFKLIGLIPIDFVVEGDTTSYDPDVETFVKKSTGLGMYDFAYGLGLSGLTKSFLPFLIKKGYNVATDSVSNRVAFVINFMNKIIKKLTPYTPRRKRKISLKMVSIRATDTNKMHDFIVKIKDVTKLHPFAFQLDLGIPHFVTMVYNPFSDTIEIIDPYNAGVFTQQIVESGGKFSLVIGSPFNTYPTHRFYVFSELN